MSAAPETATRACPLRGALENEHLWLLVGAVEKARSIAMLTAGLSVKSILEISSGTGAILERLDELDYGQDYYAVEPSREMHDYMVKRGAIGRLMASECSTLHDSNLSDKRYDLVILSHVLEHVDNPAQLLSDALDIGNAVVVEVPLEGSVAGNLRAAVKTAITGIQRHNNSAGHIQFYDRADVGSLVRWCGGKIVRSRLYVPRAEWRQSAQSGSMLRRAYSATILGLSKAFGERFWAQAYHGHYTVLVRRRTSLAVDERTRWPENNFYEHPSLSRGVVGSDEG